MLPAQIMPDFVRKRVPKIYAVRAETSICVARDLTLLAWHALRLALDAVACRFHVTM